MMKRSAFLLFMVGSLFAQQPSVVVKGNCNATASGSNLTVTVRCDSSIAPDKAKILAKQYAEILSRIRDNGISYDLVIQKLDSIQHGVDELKAATAPRRLTVGQIQALSAAVRDSGSEGLKLMYPLNDSEATGFMKDFNQALHLPPSQVQGSMIIYPGIGLHLTIDEKYLKPINEQQAIIQGAPPGCMALKLFLEHEAIPYEGEHGQLGQGSGCVLVVGAKPQ
jgi:hypothetical protein